MSLETENISEHTITVYLSVIARTLLMIIVPSNTIHRMVEKTMATKKQRKKERGQNDSRNQCH